MGENNSRFGSFFDRVQIERTALRIVNAYCSPTELHGLTEAAINSWVTRATGAGIRTCNLKSIESILKRLSSRIDALADQSRTVFSDERFPMLVSEEILQELSLACQGNNQS